MKRIQPGSEHNMIPLMGDLAFQVVKTCLVITMIREPMAELKHITEMNQNMLVKEMRKPYYKWYYRLTGEIRKHLDLSERASSMA